MVQAPPDLDLIKQVKQAALLAGAKRPRGKPRPCAGALERWSRFRCRVLGETGLMTGIANLFRISHTSSI
jgi:hypothetical protein